MCVVLHCCPLPVARCCCCTVVAVVCLLSETTRDLYGAQTLATCIKPLLLCLKALQGMRLGIAVAVPVVVAVVAVDVAIAAACCSCCFN